MIKAFYENGNGNVGAREEADFIEFVLDTLNTLYMKNYVTAARHAKLERLVLSDNKDNKEMAIRIIESLHNKNLIE
jgi:hypothetical protein